MNISEISQNMDGVNVKGLITEKSDPEEIGTRYGPAVHAKATLDDGSSSIQLNLWRDQVDKAVVGRRLRIENGFTKSGEISVGSRGRIILLEIESQ